MPRELFLGSSLLALPCRDLPNMLGCRGGWDSTIPVRSSKGDMEGTFQSTMREMQLGGTMIFKAKMVDLYIYTCFISIVESDARIPAFLASRACLKGHCCNIRVQPFRHPWAKIKENSITDIPVQLWPGGITGARAGGQHLSTASNGILRYSLVPTCVSSRTVVSKTCKMVNIHFPQRLA